MSLSAFFRRLHRDEGGQAMVEAAIILPLFVTVMAMTLELCVLASVKSVVNHAAYATCRAGIVHNADQNWMENAAAMALSPVTQSKLMAFLGGLGITFPLGDENQQDDLGFNLGTRIIKFGGQTILARLQFNKFFSGLEYLATYWVDERLSFKPSSYGLDRPPTIEELLDGTYMDQVELYTANINMAIQVSSFQLPPINEVWVLNPDDPTERYESVDDLAGKTGWTAGDTLYTEAGNKKKGLDYAALNHGTNLDLRLRVRVIHRHKLIFSFLKLVYQAVMPKHDLGDKSGDDFKAMDRARIMGYLDISSDCVMRMQSNFTMGE